MKQSETIKELATALAIFQGEITSVVKDSMVTTAKYSYKYAGLPTVIEHIKAGMTKNGLSIVQAAEPVIDVGHLVMETMLLHNSGEWIGGYTPLKLTSDDPQGMGSAITYARRYGLCAILGIASEEDDDGVAAQKPAQKATPPGSKGEPEKEHYCQAHNTPFKRFEKGTEHWYSHKIEGGGWCTEAKAGKKQTAKDIKEMWDGQGEPDDEAPTTDVVAGNTPPEGEEVVIDTALLKKLIEETMWNFKNWLKEKFDITTSEGATLKRVIPMLNNAQKQLVLDEMNRRS